MSKENLGQFQLDLKVLNKKGDNSFSKIDDSVEYSRSLSLLRLSFFNSFHFIVIKTGFPFSKSF